MHLELAAAIVLGMLNATMALLIEMKFDYHAPWVACISSTYM